MEILIFCALYSAVILGALAYTLDFKPTPQPVLNAEKDSSLMRRHAAG